MRGTDRLPAASLSLCARATANSPAFESWGLDVDTYRERHQNNNIPVRINIP